MKCPYCGNEMEKGEVQVGDILQAKLKSGGPVLWVSEEDCKKILPKKPKLAAMVDKIKSVWGSGK